MKNGLYNSTYLSTRSSPFEEWKAWTWQPNESGRWRWSLMYDLMEASSRKHGEKKLYEPPEQDQFYFIRAIAGARGGKSGLPASNTTFH